MQIERDYDQIYKAIIGAINDSDFNEEELRSALFERNMNTNEIENVLINKIKDLHDKSATIKDIDTYVSQIIMPQVKQTLTGDNQKFTDISQTETSTAKDSDDDNLSFEKNLKELIKKYPNGIDTSEKDFKTIESDYKDFFKKRCDYIVKKGEKNAFKDDPELREFMIRHNRFIPLFNLRFISAELLEQMATRFARMKKDPDDIQREYDKIELVSSK